MEQFKALNELDVVSDGVCVWWGRGECMGVCFIAWRKACFSNGLLSYKLTGSIFFIFFIFIFSSLFCANT